MKQSVRLPLICLLLGSVSVARAELQPQEIAILATSQSEDSQTVAKYYAQQRKIPAGQICVLNIPTGEVLDRKVWDQTRRQIRQWIATKQLQSKLRCFVTTFDVPLKIGKRGEESTNSKRRRRLLQLERQRRIDRLKEFADQFDAIVPDAAEATTTPFPAGGDLTSVTQYLGTRLKAAEARIKPMAPGPAQQEAIQKVTQLSVATAGLRVVVQNMQQQVVSGNSTQRLLTEYQFGRGRLTGLGEGQQLLEGLPSTPERDTNLIALIERNNGIAGSISWIDAQLKVLDSNETWASFDSELSLVMENTYPLLRWQSNYLHYNYDGAPIRELSRALMVSRLDAPTVELANGIVDKAIAAEKQGLQGTVYLDARGLAKLDGSQYAPGSQEEYDRSLLLTAKLIQENTALNVVLDDKTELFGPDSCPNAILYSGWYSLSKYVDAFQWAPGAVGFHLASGEASTLRNADSQVWCKRMLEEGVTGTIGPVYEPYLLAFPRPHEFFALFLSGKYTYAECVYRTKPTSSWVMTSIGDPLYNPFRNNPAIKDVPATYERLFGER